MVAVPPRTDNNPAKEKAEMINVIKRKIHITLFDVVNMLLAKRATASSPNNAAVQCPSNMKWPEINVADTTKHVTIFLLSFNWKERRSEQMAIPIRIWDNTKFDINIIPANLHDINQIIQLVKTMSQTCNNRAKTFRCKINIFKSTLVVLMRQMSLRVMDATLRSNF